MKEKVAIQGIEGSFHHQVAQEYFGVDVQVEKCLSFPEVVTRLLSGKAGKAVMAIENSTAGSILPNYSLMDENRLRVIGEHYIPISMNLMAMPGQTIADIKRVYSHPMALLQCMDFFRKNRHIKLIEDTDTAEVARRISWEKEKGVAAVGSKAAAGIFGLEILAAQIHTIKNNATRFLILDTGEGVCNENGADKASLKFVLESKRGSLVKVLNTVRDCGLDMTKIQSVPVIETPWNYSFFVDVTYTESAGFLEAKHLLEKNTQQFKVLGTYKNKLV